MAIRGKELVICSQGWLRETSRMFFPISPGGNWGKLGETRLNMRETSESDLKYSFNVLRYTYDHCLH